MLLDTSKTSGLPKNAGFTLLELLVSMAILIILAAVTLASFGAYARVQQYQRFVEEVGHTLRLARQQTLASKGDMIYGVYVGTSTVELFSGSNPTPGSANNTIITANTNLYTVTASLDNSQNYLTFERVSGKASTPGEIVIYSASLGRTATYTIHESGLVE